MNTLKKVKDPSLVYYIAAIVAFLVSLTCCILVFFCAVRKSIDTNTNELIMKSMQQQKEHFSIVIETQFGHLEGIAAYLGEQEELISENTLALTSKLTEHSGLLRLFILRPDGSGCVSDGTTTNVSSRAYFQRSIKGERALSDPLESVIANANVIALSVPIYDKEGNIVGVLAGAYNVTELNELLFEDLYDGEGYSIIVGSDGELISIDSQKAYATKNTTFFEYYGELLFESKDSIDIVREDFLAQRADCLKTRRGRDVRYLVYTPLGLKDWMLCYVVPVSSAQSAFSFITFYELLLSAALALSVLLLFTAFWLLNRKHQTKLLKKMQTDSLTELLNKESTESIISKWLSGNECFDLQALLMLDLDRFKQINDTYGHAAGDEVLRQASKIIRDEFRETDIIGRIGGDEFIILMKNVRCEDTITHHVEKVCQRFCNMELDEIRGQAVSCSIGAAYAPHHGCTFQELYEKADIALYQAKSSGRNGYALYQEKL